MMYFHPHLPHCLASEKSLSHSIGTHNIAVILKIIKIKSKYNLKNIEYKNYKI